MDQYYHNIISENLLSQVDEEGRESMLMKEISDHNIDKSVNHGFEEVSHYNKRMKANRRMGKRNTILDPS